MTGQILTQEPTALTFAVAEPTLAELRQLKTTWTQEAHDQGCFDKLLDIGRELGEPVETQHHGTFRIWKYDARIPVSPIVVVYQEVTGRLIKKGGWNSYRDTSEWENIERLWVYLGHEKPTQRDSMGNPTFYMGKLVCRYEKSSHPTGFEKELIVVGQWVGAAVMCHQESKNHARHVAMDHNEYQRQELVKELLIGMEV